MEGEKVFSLVWFLEGGYNIYLNTAFFFLWSAFINIQTSTSKVVYYSSLSYKKRERQNQMNWIKLSD